MTSGKAPKTLWQFLLRLFYFSIRKQPGDSYFDRLPPTVPDIKANYVPACHCGETDCNMFNAFNPAFTKGRQTTVFNLCDSVEKRDKRDIHYSDELTDEDYKLFKKPFTSANQLRFKRALPTFIIPKQNATSYCAQKIADTKIGKLCNAIGVDVQALVDSCSEDIAVSTPSSNF